MIRKPANFKGTNEEMTCKRCDNETDSYKQMVRYILPRKSRKSRKQCRYQRCVMVHDNKGVKRVIIENMSCGVKIVQIQ